LLLGFCEVVGLKGMAILKKASISAG